jgi:hypothetical protein
MIVSDIKIAQRMYVPYIVDHGMSGCMCNGLGEFQLTK